MIATHRPSSHSCKRLILMPTNSKNMVPPFGAAHLDAIAKVLGDTDDGLTGPEIGHFLAVCRIEDISPDLKKSKRLYNAFAAFQTKNQVGNNVIAFIKRAMDPSSYTNNPSLFQSRLNELNAVLVSRFTVKWNIVRSA
jgi:hypothetical protein